MGNILQEERSHLADTLYDYASRLQQGGRITRKSQIVPPAEQENVRNSSLSSTTTYPIDDGFRMVPKHATLRGLWDEWYGKNSFHDEKGGVHGRNMLYGHRWRKGVVKHHHYSRTQRIVEAISRFAEDNDITGEEAVERFEEAYKENNCSISSMVKHLQTIGLITVRQRATKEDATTDQNNEEI